MFSQVFVCPEGDMHGEEGDVCHEGVMCGKGVCVWWRGLCMAKGVCGEWGGGGHAWQGACVAGRDDHCSGRYASYWNAFLLANSFEFNEVFMFWQIVAFGVDHSLHITVIKLCWMKRNIPLSSFINVSSADLLDQSLKTKLINLSSGLPDPWLSSHTYHVTFHS